jgi:hypothetical protein
LQIKILEQWERDRHDPDPEGELGFAYTRLALIEEAEGQTEATLTSCRWGRPRVVCSKCRRSRIYIIPFHHG